jgi:hypothetical protein
VNLPFEQVRPEDTAIALPVVHRFPILAFL